MNTVHRNGSAVKPRCSRCGGALERDRDGERYCPDCVSYATVPEAPPAADPHAWYVAATATGTYVDGKTDLEELLRIVREEVMGTFPADEDAVITLGNRVVAIVLGDTGAVVRVRP